MSTIRPRIKINFDDREITFTSSQLISFTCSENIMDSDLSINPGICEQYANIEIYDRDETLHLYASLGLLHKDQSITLISVDSNNNEVILGDYVTEEWTVENNNSIVKITCRDTSHKFENIIVPKATIEDRSVDTLLDIVFTLAPDMNWMYLDTDTEAHCENTIIPNSWYQSTDLKTILEYICNVGMLRIYYFNKTFFVGRCIS